MKKPAAVLTVAGEIYHQCNRQARSVPLRYARPLLSDEQMFGPRKFVVTGKWVPLDAGWVRQAGLLVLANKEGTDLQRKPTQEEAARVAARVVEIAFDHGGTGPLVASIQVRPGESQPLDVPDVSCVRVRCRSECATVYLTVIPE